MGGTARQFNKMYSDYKKKFKKPLLNISDVMPIGFTDQEFVNKFRELYPHLWIDLQNQYDYWHKKNEYIIKHGKKSRYNFRNPYNFILDCSHHLRIKTRKNQAQGFVSNAEQVEFNELEILAASKRKLDRKKEKLVNSIKYVQEIHPGYADYFIDEYFRTHDLHKKLEIIRELSKFKSDKIIKFFYIVNANTRNHSLKMEAMHYIQSLDLPFVLGRKKQGKKNYIDNEIVKNPVSPDLLLKRIFVSDLEKAKKFDVFISHSSSDEKDIIDFYKIINKHGYVAFIDWVNDKFDLRREWVNLSTPQVLKKRLEQSTVLVYYYSEKAQQSKWIPWEIGLFDMMKGKVCIYGLNSRSTGYPEYLDLYVRLVIEDGNLLITYRNQKIAFNKWIQ